MAFFIELFLFLVALVVVHIGAAIAGYYVMEKEYWFAGYTLLGSILVLTSSIVLAVNAWGA